MQRHWLVTLQKISTSGRDWDADIPKSLLQDESCGEVDTLAGLSSDVHWRVSLQRVAKSYHLRGDWKAVMKRSCSRCNVDFDLPIMGETDRFFQLGSAKVSQLEEEADTLACEYVDKLGEINLLDVLREDIWLARKADVICSNACRGLCQDCGVDLNTDTCQCEKDGGDHPFAALRDLKLNS